MNCRIWNYDSSRFFLSLFCGFLLALPGYSDAVAKSPPTLPQQKSVLIINSYHPGYSWSDAMLKGEFGTIRETLPDCVFLVQYVDSKRFYNKDFLKLTKEELEIKLQFFKPDVILANDNPAVDLVFKYRSELFADIPVVFCGFNGYELIADTLPDGVTGVAEHLFLAETAEMILNLHPSVKNIRIVSSGMGMGPIADPENFFMRTLDVFSERVKITWHPHNGFDELVECCGNSQNDSVILIGGFDSFEGGAFYSQDDVVNLFSRIARVPVYSLFQTCNDRGILGLGVVSAELQGEAAGQLAIKILKGAKASDIKVVEQVSWQPTFDADEMKRWGVDRANLPAGALILNELPGFYETYKVWIWLGLSLILFQSLLILILLYRRMFKKLKKDLSLSQISFRNIMDSSPFISIILTDLDGNIKLFNSGSEKMLGYTLNQVKGRKVIQLLCPPDVYEHLRNEVRSKLCSEVTERDVLVYLSVQEQRDVGCAYVCFDGSLCYIAMTVSPIVDYHGNSSGYLVVGSDLTAIHKVQQQLKESQKFLSSVIDAIPDGVIIVGRDYCIQYANRAFSKITGCSHAEAIGMNYMDLSNGRNSKEVFQNIVTTISSGKVWSGRLMNMRKDGTSYTEKRVLTPVLDSFGNTTSVIGTISDISQELAREDELRQQQKMAAIGQLAGGVAHDFNNILQSILGYSEILLTRFTPGSVDYQNIEHVTAAAKRAAMLTRGLLTLGRKNLDPRNLKLIDLNYFLNDSFLLLDLISTEKVKIVYELSDNLWQVSFSPDKFYQVVMNLVTNARDAMPDGGRITIKTCNLSISEITPMHHVEPGDYVCLTVEDQGCGISHEIIDKIFDPFFTLKDVGKGAGLGLTMVYVNIRNCGGVIKFDSIMGEGTKVSIYLPANACKVVD